MGILTRMLHMSSLIWLHIANFECHQNAKLDYKTNISNDIVNKLSPTLNCGGVTQNHPRRSSTYKIMQ